MPKPSLLDQYMPAWQFAERHHITVRAAAPRVYAALANLETGDSRLVKALMRLRELPRRGRERVLRDRGGSTLEGMHQAGFLLLAEEPPRELVMGAAGRFWRPTPELAPLEPAQFPAFARPGSAKLAFNFLVTPLGPGLCRLSTETRVATFGPAARRNFRLYWLVIRPFSGLIRRIWLDQLRRRAEAAQGLGPGDRYYV
ncbi:MAG: hypothetical protein KQJ78_02450 [Deltaproteobacteria bacterium]|nr:hypothetical protein [Deltaproteobacteria bacterium]